MHHGRLWALLVLCCSASGCHVKQLRTANQDLERENFQLEQRLDELTWQLEDCRRMLETYQCDAQQPAAKSPRATTSPPPRREAPSRNSEPETDSESEGPPRVELPDEARAKRRLPRESVPRFSGPPAISPPDPNVPDGVLPRPAPSAAPESMPEPSPPAKVAAPREPLPPDASDAPPFLGERPPTAEAEPIAAPPLGEIPAPEPRLIAHGDERLLATLSIDPQATMWRRTPGNAASDEGLQVVVEARDAEGHKIAADGKVAIVVIDPAGSGAAARLARWDFASDEIARLYQHDASGGAWRFTLQWPGKVPQAEDLLLFVRLTTTAGEQLVAEHSLRPTAATQPASWTEEVDTPPKKSPAPIARRESRGWQRATRPLPPREKPVATSERAVAETARKDSPGERLDGPSGGAERDGDEGDAPPKRGEPASTWAPYR